MEEKGLLAVESKKMQSTLRREMRKIKRNLDGIRLMERLPGVLVLIDARRENIALCEARKLKIPTVCLMDTDSNPELVDLPIPGNDDAMRAIELVLEQLTEAIMQGKTGKAKNDDLAEDGSRRVRSRRMSTARAAQVLSSDNHSSETDDPLERQMAREVSPTVPAPTNNTTDHTDETDSSSQ
jgi:small subunit ribosomal protein S2